MKTFNTNIRIGAALGLLAVAFGAFGAHALKPMLTEHGTTAVWETAVRYQMWHALAILLCAALSTQSHQSGKAPLLFACGTALFSGSLYLLALGGPKWLGPVTPLGGLLLIAGWASLLVASLRSSK